jgi:isoleucyl-tRNA synthetase
MYRILEALVRWLAPLLAFTAEEIWQHMPKTVATRVGAAAARGESVLFETWYDGLEALQGSAEQRVFWSDLLAVRSGAAKLLEGLRNTGAIGAALEADVSVFADPQLIARYQPVAAELRFFFISSNLELEPRERLQMLAHPLPAIAAEARGDDPDKPRKAAMPVSLSGHDVWVQASASANTKCIRCWHRRADVGVYPDHPEICGRCVQNLPDGPGEVREYF